MFALCLSLGAGQAGELLLHMCLLGPLTRSFI